MDMGLLLPYRVEHVNDTGLIQCTEDPPRCNGSPAPARADESGSELHRTGWNSSSVSMHMVPLHSCQMLCVMRQICLCL